MSIDKGDTLLHSTVIVAVITIVHNHMGTADGSKIMGKQAAATIIKALVFRRLVASQELSHLPLPPLHLHLRRNLILPS